MINKLELKPLPFVDECPDVGQKRIRWVRNGELLSAATTKYGHDGVLNEAGVGLHEDILALETNANTTKDSLNVVIDNVNNINDALAAGENIEVIKQIALNKENIEILQVHMQFAETNIGTLEADTSFLKEDVGVYDPAVDSVYRPIRDDLLFIKREMGAYPDQDINGQTVLGAVSSGMKRRIINNSSAIVDNIRRITKLENDYADSDVGSLSIKINEIREELGPRTTGVANPPVYTRLATLETITKQSDETIAEIKTAIGLGVGPSINTRVTTLETSSANTAIILSAPITGLVPRMTAVETAIGTASVPASINGRLGSLRTDLNALTTVVGNETSSGLRGQVAWLTQSLGQDVNPAPTSVQGRLATVTIQTNQNANAIQGLQTEIGNNNTGLKGSVLTLTRKMDGTNPNGNTVEERGVLLSVKQLEINMLTKIDEAPKDGKAYVRKDGAWVLLSDFLTP